MNKILAWIIKVSGLFICLPVTWQIAGRLFADIQPSGLQYLMQIAGVCLVEGVLISSWVGLDYDSKAANAVKIRYGLTAIAMYVGLWVLALSHGEGITGIVFRLALGAALVGSIYDSGIYSIVRENAKMDKDISRAFQVRNHKRKAEIRVAKLETDLWEQSEIDRLQKENNRILKASEIAHRHEMKIMAGEADHSTMEQRQKLGKLKNGNRPYDVAKARETRQRRAAERQEIVSQIVSTNPTMSSSELVANIMQMTGVKEPTAWQDLKVFREAGNGHREIDFLKG